MPRKQGAKVMPVMLMVTGAVLLSAGLNEYGALGSSLDRALGGSMSGEAALLLIGGGVCAALGLLKLLGK